MKCKEIIRLINLELDSLATPEQIEAVKAHLVTCTACSNEKRELISLRKTVSDTFTDMEIPGLSAGFDSRFEDALSRRLSFIDRITGFFTPFRIKWALAPSFIIAACIVWFTILMPKPVNIPVPAESLNETDTSVLIRYAVLETRNAYDENALNAQAKELLSNFL
ncbi:MAG: zf-HC2 domain-containing protein [Elusimicrobiota bacterium]